MLSLGCNNFLPLQLKFCFPCYISSFVPSFLPLSGCLCSASSLLLCPIGLVLIIVTGLEHAFQFIAFEVYFLLSLSFSFPLSAAWPIYIYIKTDNGMEGFSILVLRLLWFLQLPFLHHQPFLRQCFK